MTATMNAAALKEHLISKIRTATDVQVLQKIQGVFDACEETIPLASGDLENSDFWQTISKAEQLSIQEGLENAENGKVVPHSQAKKIYEKWL